MQTYDFLRILQQFPHLSVKEAEAVLSLKENFPFSQVLHTVSARASKDQGFSIHKSALQMAAVYAADRAVLKDLVEGTGASPIPVSENERARSSESVDLATQVMDDLQRLHKLRENFELLFIDPTAVSIQNPGPVELPLAQVDTPAVVEESEVVEEPVDEIVQTESEKESEKELKSRKERIVELARNRNSIPEAVEFETILKSRRRKKDSLDSFIDQIATSKEELTPESEKQKEQIELIDHFIRIQPSITGSKEKQDLANDLSTIKTGDFTENIISETLVEILLKQGKKEKAMEVLKKLIWKFPQKKAYFASQIEELKK